MCGLISWFDSFAGNSVSLFEIKLNIRMWESPHRQQLKLKTKFQSMAVSNKISGVQEQNFKCAGEHFVTLVIICYLQ